MLPSECRQERRQVFARTPCRSNLPEFRTHQSSSTLFEWDVRIPEFPLYMPKSWNPNGSWRMQRRIYQIPLCKVTMNTRRILIRFTLLRCRRSWDKVQSVFAKSLASFPAVIAIHQRSSFPAVLQNSTSNAAPPRLESVRLRLRRDDLE